MEQPHVHIVHYNDYDLLRHLLTLVHGFSLQTFKNMNDTIWKHRGTPQNNRDWSNPDEWIEEILFGDAKKLALRLWIESGRRLNPRWVSGQWQLCSYYQLIEIDAAGNIIVTSKGEDFINHPAGETVSYIDYQEGLFHLLAIVAEHGPGKRSDLLPHFAKFLAIYSRLKSNSTMSSAYFWRMVNLTNRGLLVNEGNSYRISQEGLNYLGSAGERFTGSKVSETESILQDIRQLVKAHENLVRQKIAETLATINPYQFEGLIQRLLEAMGYKDVEVTSPSNDGGVDVVANIQVGITKVREVVQVKRHRGSIGRPVLDQLRGSLHRFGANRGTIITTGKFTKGTHEAAFEMGAAPIMLIDGETLIGLLIENQIGARMDTVKVLKFEAGDFVLEEESSNL